MTPTLRPFALLGPAALLLILMLTACTAAGQPVLPAADPAARTGGTLRIGITAPGSVDPGNVYEPSGALVVRALCTPLLTTDPETGALRPGIVSSWVVSDDGLALSLRLRKDVRFTDGSLLRAADVAFSLSRIASADFASKAADRLAVVRGYPQVHGDVPTDDDAARERLLGVQVRDDRTVQITLFSPRADFVRLLSSPLLSPVSRRAVLADPEGSARSPVCVGPYRLEQPYTPGDRALALVRSDTASFVDGALPAGGPGLPDRLELTIFADEAAAAAAAVAGRVDVAPARPTDVTQVQSGTGPMLELIGFPTTVAPFDNPLVRRALSLAIDRETLVARLFPHTRVPATGFVPGPTELGESCAAVPARGDVAAATALLRQAGVDLRAVRVPLPYDDELRHRGTVTEVARQWQQTLGLVAVPTPLSFASYLRTGTGQTGFAGPFRFSWSVPWSDIDGYLRPLYTTGAIGRDGFARFSDPALDRVLLREASEATDPADRELAQRQALSLLCQAMPMAPLTASLARFVVADRVGAAGGRYVDSSTGGLLLRGLYLRS